MQPTNRLNNPLLTEDQESIVALCTPRGSGAIALIRLCGDDVCSVAGAIAKLSSGSSLSQAPTHTIHHGYVVDGENVIDEVMFLVMKGPKTFTGQDTVEVTCHNNQFIIEQIIKAALAAGARVAKPGEFTKRAFLNGKIDLVQAESINDLIHAQTEAALRRSMEQLSGSLSQYLHHIETDLIALLGYVEASFEFLDEEQRDLDFDQTICQRTEALRTQVEMLLTQFALQKQIKEGVRIAIVGLVNVGKSTLFNVLVNKERAIVTDQAGTTRDSIETSVYRNGMFWLVIDTAGLRQTADVIEQKGIERSFAEADAADVVLVVLDATCPLTPQATEQYGELLRRYGQKCLIVVNKVDDNAASNHHERALAQQNVQTLESIQVSAKTREGIANLEQTIEAKVQQLFAQSNTSYLLNQRHFKLLTEIGQQLKNIANSYSDGVHYEMIACHLKDLVEKVSELTGKNVSERVLDAVFNEFCIGK